MRNIFLVRHAMPFFPNNDKFCIGQSDFPLSEAGIIQAMVLKYWTKEMFSGKTVFCSRLSRAKETARFLSDDPIVVDGLEEMNAGLWDGLSFTEIEEKWPDVFKNRVENKNIPIPGAEEMECGLLRFTEAIKRCLEKSSGDIVIVAHSTVIQAFLSHCASRPLDESRMYTLPYCSVSNIKYDDDFILEYWGKIEEPEFSLQLYSELSEYVDGDDEKLINILRELDYSILADKIEAII